MLAVEQAVRWWLPPRGNAFRMNWLLLKNSLLVSGLTTLLAVALGFVAALALAALERRGRNLLLAAAVVALALPPFLVTNCWLHYLGATGAWRAWLPLNPFSLGGTVWILVLLLWPITLWAVWGAWQRLEAAQLEADPAVTGWALIRWLLFPLARPALGLAALLTFVLALNNFAVPSLLQVKVFPAEVWVQFNTTLDTAAAFRASWPLIVAPVLLLVGCGRREIAWPCIAGPVAPAIIRRQLGAVWVWSCGGITLLLCALSVGLPLVQLGAAKRTWIELAGALAAGQGAVWNSFWFAAVSATLVVGLGLAAGVMAPGRARSTAALPALEMLPWLLFLVPGVLLGIGLIALFNRGPFLRLYRSAGIVIVALVLRYLAIGWTGARHALRATDRDLAEAARLDGAGRWRVLRCVEWPQIAPLVAAAWYVVYLLGLWDVESLVLIIPPGGETLALRVFNLLHYGHNAQVNALCLALLGLAVAPLAVWAAIRSGGKWMRRREIQNPETAAGRAASTGIGRRTKCAPPHLRGGPAGLRRSLSGFRLNVGLGAVRHGRQVGGILGLVFLLGGCSPPSPENAAPVASRFFRAVRIIGTRGVAPGQFNQPRSVAVDREDNLFVVDMTGRVQKFAPDGRYLLSWQMPTTDFDPDLSLERDADGNILVLEPHFARVNHFTPDGRLLGQWGARGTNAGQFQMPCAVAVDSRGEVFVSEYDQVERIQKFRLEPASVGIPNSALRSPPSNGAVGPAPLGRFLLSFGTPGTAPGELNRAEGLGVDAQDRLYVADSCNHRIQVFDADGRFLRAFGQAGSGPGALSYPYDVCVDAEGRVIVWEFGNSRLQVFDAGGRSLEIIGGPGAAPGRFANPWSVALDSHGNLYVADTQNHRVQKFIRGPSPSSKAKVQGPTSAVTGHGLGLGTLDFGPSTHP